MKTYFQLKEELSQLNEMEMLTHKKKIADAENNVRKVLAKHTSAAKKVYDTTNKHLKKSGKNDAYRQHLALAKRHQKAGQFDTRGGHTHHSLKAHELARDLTHIEPKHRQHALKIHNELVDAHNKLVAAKKASPLHKAKSAVDKVAKKIGVKEAKVDEISNKTLGSYHAKAAKQYRDSIRKKDDDGYTPKKRAFHKARFAKRHKGIGSVYRRDLVRRDPETGNSAQQYLHNPSKTKRLSTGKGGDTLTKNPASKLPKTYKDPNRK